MDPHRWQLAKDTFHAAVGLDPARRDALLRERCAGDDELMREVRALLDAHKDEPSVAATGDTAGAETVADKTNDRLHGVGRRVGPYRLVKVLGEGGMGVVFLAERMEPIRQVVALKLMRAGVGSRQALSRFDAERQALALMDHPNVAKVFDAGVDDDDGRPYFVMEYVAGAPITVFCDEARLSVRQRLELFAQACDAVGHAHQKAVIHRDLKPGNILVTTVDGEPVVKVIDFGVAKAIGVDAASQPLTRHTADGQWVGTPEYMSPEQTGEAGSDVDTRTDVYSLGVVLYELLTGCLPLDGKLLRRAPAEVAQRMIRESDAPRPSTRFGDMGGTAADVAGRRSCTARTLTNLLRRELEWIPIKAVRKRPDERYASVAALAADVRNYLAGRPLEAGPESGWYRARKLLSRNRGKTAAVTAVVASLALGFAGTYWMMRRAAASLASEKVQRRLADERFQLAEKRRVRSEHDRYAAEFRLAAQSAVTSNGIHDAIQMLNSCDPRLRGWEWAHLRGRLAASVTTLYPPGATGGLGPIALQPDGVSFAVVGVIETKGGAHAAESADDTDDGDSNPPPTLRVWTWDGKQWAVVADVGPAELPGVTGGVPDPFGRVVAFGGQPEAPIYLWDVTARRVMWKSHDVPVSPGGFPLAVGFTADGEHFAYAHQGKLDLVKLEDGSAKPGQLEIPETSQPTVLAFDAGLTRVAVGTADGLVLLLDAKTGAELGRARADHRAVCGLRFSDDPPRLLCSTGAVALDALGYPAERPGNVAVLNFDPLRVVDSFPCAGAPLDAAFDRHGTLAAVTSGGELHEWSYFVPHDLVRHPSYDPHPDVDSGDNYFARFSPDCRRAFRSKWETVQIIDCEKVRGFRRIDLQFRHPGKVLNLRGSSPRGLLALAGLGAPGSSDRGDRHSLPQGVPSPVEPTDFLSETAAKAMSPDARTVVVAEGRKVKLLEWPSGRETAASADLPQPCSTAAFSGDGRVLWVITAPPALPQTATMPSPPPPDGPRHLLALDPVTAVLLPQRRVFDGAKWVALETSPDGRWVAVRTTDPRTYQTRLEVLDAALRTVFSLTNSRAPPHARAPDAVVDIGTCAFRPDGSAVVVEIHLPPLAEQTPPGPADDGPEPEPRKFLRQYLLPGGEVVGADYGDPADANLRGAWIDFVRYSPDARRMVTGGHQLRIWDAASGQLLSTLDDEPGSSGQFGIGRFLSDEALVASDSKGSLYVFTAPPPATAPPR